MNGLSKAQRSYDRQLPDEGRQRAEREFSHQEFATVGANVIRSSKFFDLPMAEPSSDGEQKTTGTYA